MSKSSYNQSSKNLCSTRRLYRCFFVPVNRTVKLSQMTE